MEQKKSKKGAPPRYDEAFKLGAIKMVTDGQRPAQEVAQELGICIDTLRSWLKGAGQQPTAPNRENRAAQRVKELEAENRALRKSVAILEPEKLFPKYVVVHQFFLSPAA